MSRACCYCDVTCWFPGDRFCRAQNIQPKYQQNLFLIYVGLRNVPFKATLCLNSVQACQFLFFMKIPHVQTCLNMKFGSTHNLI